jgi:C4-dicarboxylate transporter
MLKLILRYRTALLGVVLGAAAGYAWYYFIGCSNGTCAITSRPLNSTLYGAFMGFLLAQSFPDKTENNNTYERKNNN